MCAVTQRIGRSLFPSPITPYRIAEASSTLTSSRTSTCPRPCGRSARRWRASACTTATSCAISSPPSCGARATSRRRDSARRGATACTCPSASSARSTSWAWSRRRRPRYERGERTHRPRPRGFLRYSLRGDDLRRLSGPRRDQNRSAACASGVFPSRGRNQTPPLVRRRRADLPPPFRLSTRRPRSP